MNKVFFLGVVALFSSCASLRVPLSALRPGGGEELSAVIASGGDVNAVYPGGISPLMEASHRNLPEIARLLIDAGAHIEARDKDGFTSLMYAAAGGAVSTAELLVQKGAHTEAKEYLTGKTALFFAVENNSPRTVKHLFSGEEAVFDGGVTALMHASARGVTEACAELIKSGADIKKKDDLGRDAIFHAVKNNMIKTADILIRSGASVKAEYDSGLLHLAAAKNNIDMIKLLLGAGADMSVKDRHAFSPFGEAVRAGSFEAASFFLGSGALANERQGDLTLLMIAAKNNDLKMASLLTENMADVDAASSDGTTAIFYAAMRNYHVIAEFLIGMLADVNAADAKGWTPLMAAVAENSLETARLLIKNGADINARNAEALNALEIAKYKRNDKMISALKASGAREY
ncbi:MAG: ankyrin repeat domain-containing protein [Elusimicrobiota bacterium]|nr:ankyrin repeat domain-containing protein [Elusimicrobiota bacterium]